VAACACCHLLTSPFISGHLPDHLAFIGSDDVLAMGSVRRAGGQAEHPVRLDFPFLGNLLWHFVDYVFITLFDLPSSRFVFIRVMC
jgi:hypothetical protein